MKVLSNAHPVWATVTLVVALMSAAAWWSIEAPPDDVGRVFTTQPAGKPDLHVAMMIDMTLLAMSIGTLLGFGAGWFLRPQDVQPVPMVGGWSAHERSGKAERTLTTIFDATTDFVVQTDPAGRLTYLNPSARRRLGISPNAPLHDKSAADFFPAHTVKRFTQEMIPVALADGVWVGESVAYDADRREFPVWHMVIAHRDAHGRLEHFSGVLRDIAEETAAREALRRNEEILRELTDALPVQIAVIDRDERLRYTNTAYEQALRRRRDELIGASLQEVLEPHAYQEIEPRVKRALEGERLSFDRLHLVGDEPRWQELTYIPQHDTDGGVCGVLAVLQDITERKHEEVRLRQLVLMDPLTGLLNRSGFDQRLAQLVGGSVEIDGMAALLYVDLDRFKSVNDGHGHSVGDELLRIFAKRLKNIVRPGDAMARLGGDEFAIVLFGLHDASNARLVASKVVRAARLPFWIEGRSIRIGASVGIAVAPPGSAEWATLLDRADAMLYRAKAAGRGQHAMSADADSEAPAEESMRSDRRYLG